MPLCFSKFGVLGKPTLVCRCITVLIVREALPPLGPPPGAAGPRNKVSKVTLNYFLAVGGGGRAIHLGDDLALDATPLDARCDTVLMQECADLDSRCGAS